MTNCTKYKYNLFYFDENSGVGTNGIGLGGSARIWLGWAGYVSMDRVGLGGGFGWGWGWGLDRLC